MFFSQSSHFLRKISEKDLEQSISRHRSSLRSTIFWSFQVGHLWFQIYSTFILTQKKTTVRPIYGGFPVKFRTYVGKPIEYDPDVSPEELQTKTRIAIEQLISQHQRIPGSITHALLDRFRKPLEKDK